MATTYNDIDSYIAGFPAGTQQILQQIRSVILNAAPQAQEVISYQMPGFKWNGMLVWFAAYPNHIGFYPTASGIRAFQHKLADYKLSKGTIRLPLDKPIPVDLISEIVRFKVAENSQKATTRKK